MKTIGEIIKDTKPDVKLTTEFMLRLLDKPINERYNPKGNEVIKLLANASNLIKSRGMKNASEPEVLEFILETYDLIIRDALTEELKENGRVLSPIVSNLTAEVAKQVSVSKDTVKPSQPDMFTNSIMYARDMFCKTPKEKAVLDKVLSEALKFKRRKSLGTE